jgi:DNA-binding PadR family transcriptional regulator
MKLLTRQEEMVLMAIYHLDGESSLVKIREFLLEKAGRDWSVSSIYVPLDRLHRMGCLHANVGEPEARRGGRAVKKYRLSKAGFQALEEVRNLHNSLWGDVKNLAAGKE